MKKGKYLGVKPGEKKAFNNHFLSSVRKHTKYMYIWEHGYIFISAATRYSEINKTGILFLALHGFFFCHFGHISISLIHVVPIAQGRVFRTSSTFQWHLCQLPSFASPLIYLTEPSPSSKTWENTAGADAP